LIYKELKNLSLNGVEVRKMGNGMSEEEKEKCSIFRNTVTESWLNCLDRLCFCIRKGYLKEREWKAEYSNYIKMVVETLGDKHNLAARYKNIVCVYIEWSRE
jgi:hypothetical protein